MKAICDQASGELYSNNFTKPLPAIGLYIAAASLACFLFMALDILTSFRDTIYWIKCKFFKLNALNLTLLSIATKLPADLNAPMPGPQHQLTKVSGVAFLCVSMGFFFPSLGTMDAPEVLSNMAALAILVLTVAADICIQIGTGAIFTFIPEHILLLCTMLLIMLTMFVVSIYTQVFKFVASYAETESKKHSLSSSKKDALSSSQRVLSGTETGPQARFDSYKRILPEIWTSASTNNVQCLMNRGAFSCSVGFLSILSAAILVELEVRYLLLLSPGTNFPSIFCKGDSDYGWSIPVILISQTLVALLASLAISFRLFDGIDVWKPSAIDLIEPAIVHRMRFLGPNPFFDYFGHKATAWRWAEYLATALLCPLLFVVAIINISIWSIVSIVYLLFVSFGLLLSHYFSRTNRNQGGTISSASVERGKPGSWFCCNIEYVVETWLQKGSHRPTTHLLELLTRYNGLVGYTDWSRDPIWLLFRSHVNDLHGSCYFFLAATVHISRLLFMNMNPSEVSNLATAMEEAKKLLLFVDKWLLPRHDDRKVGRTAGKLIWDLMNTRRYGQADAQGVTTFVVEEVLKRASDELDLTYSSIYMRLVSLDQSALSVFKSQFEHVREGITSKIRDHRSALEWLRAGTTFIVVYCLSLTLEEINPDKPYLMKLEMEDVREAAHVLGMIEALKQPLFPMFEAIWSQGLFL